MINGQPETCIVINTFRGHNPMPSRFRRTLALGQHDHVSRLPHPESVISPGGTSAVSIIHALGHNGRPLKSLTKLNPQSLREMSQITASARHSRSRLHIFGIIDLDSPYGSRRALEETMRLVGRSGLDIRVHVGVFHPTPKEYILGMQELESLSNERMRIGSVFPIESALSQRLAHNYVNSLHFHIEQPVYKIPELPLRHPILFADSRLHPSDQSLIVNHQFHGLHPLSDALSEHGANPSRHLHQFHPVDSTLYHSIGKGRHYLLVSDRAHYRDAYIGEYAEHPYYESMLAASAHEALEMLISPHFGYHQTPFRTIVLVDEPSHKDFDWLLASYLRQRRSQPYYCCLLLPDDPRGSIVLSNITLSQPDPTFSELHRHG